jgi:paraquat-inducible protein B
VLFFDESIKGLSIGAPVKFRGVTIGSVTDIKLRFDSNDMSIDMPVFIEIESDRIQQTGDRPLASKILEQRRQKEIIKKLIHQEGLRAQLQMDSLVTGKLFIAVDMHPDKPLRLLGTMPDYEEIPTITSSREELSKTIEDLPLEELVEKTMSAIEGIDRLVNSPDLTASIHSIRLGLEDFRKLINNIDGQVDPVAVSFRDTGLAAKETLDQIKGTLEEMESLTGKNSPIYYEVTKALEDLSAAARSIHIMADYLQRHPEALISGKSGKGGN